MRRLLASVAVVFFFAPIVFAQTPVSHAPLASDTPLASSGADSADTAATTDAGNQASDRGKTTAAGAALATMFSPTRAPKRKTMGLLQRSFLDLADQGDQELEVAIVVDGTDSMATELAGVRRSINQMLADLRTYRNNEVRAAVVVYRDAGSPSGKTEILVRDFTSDEKIIEKAVANLLPESGAPFFHELADLGLHRALTELPWTDDDQVTKWILMFGDAPPYAESYTEANAPESYRRFATPLLVNLARRKNIRINCVLCTSSDNVGDSYDQSLDQTREFMSTLSAGTDGLMLDLSYEAIRTAMIDAEKRPDVGLAKIEPITGIDLAAVRRDTIAKAGNVQNVSLAILPHMSLQNISWDPRHPAVRVSTALRTKFAKVPGVRVASPRDIKEQLRRLSASGIRSDNAIRGLAARLGVDFVVWGSLANNQTDVQTAAYRRDTGQQAVPISLKLNSGETAQTLITAFAKNADGNDALKRLVSNMRANQAALESSMAETPATNDDLLTAIEALDQALAYESGSDDSVTLLETADAASRAAIASEAQNPVARWLQSNVAYNQAARLYSVGEVEAAKKRMREMKIALSLAYRNSQKIEAPSLMTEVQADYHLLIERNIEKAVAKYDEMTDPNAPNQSQLRGHWMLAGIYAGDWGNENSEFLSAEKSRQHLTEILANWPESPETRLLKEWLRWDETADQTEFNYLPKLNLELAGA